MDMSKVILNLGPRKKCVRVSAVQEIKVTKLFVDIIVNQKFFGGGGGGGSHRLVL
jgi:hypothetical protein